MYTGQLTQDEINRRMNEGLVLRGNTFEHHLEIKAVGGYWVPKLNAWLMPSREACIKLGAQYTENIRQHGWWLRDFKRRVRRRQRKQHG